MIPPLRGTIYVTDKNDNLIPVAYSYYVYDLYFYPPKAKNFDIELEKIAQILGKNKEDLLEKIKNRNQAVILEKNLDEKTKNRISQLRFDSVFFEEKVIRKYPFNDFLSTVLGFAVYNEEQKITKGLYGLEKYYDEYLRGETGILSKFGTYKPPRKGYDLILNIDYYLQTKLEKILENALENYKAEGGLIIVINAKTGKILGVAEKPSFNLNEYNKVKDPNLYISRISLTYEPGSVMKPFFYASAFEENLVSPTSTYFDAGYVTLNNKTIYNFDKKGRGEVDLKTALEQSLNTGSVYISQILGKTRFINTLHKFRFTSQPDIDFPLLGVNNFKNLYPPQGREVNFGTASFGQGIAVSPLSLLNGFQVFANEGKITNLRFVSKIITPDNSSINNESKIIVNNVLSLRTINIMKEILEGVVENQAKKAKVLGYRIGGKTGSAEIPEKTGYSDEVITTFIGFLPVSNPQFLVLVRLDKPNKGLLSFGTAVPTFKQVADFLINYYNIEPDKIEEFTKKY
ncbi:MAG: peptidoglycan D,D-transpeptidase FtsI family protein [bacterium]